MDDERPMPTFHAVAREIFALHEAGRYREALARVEAVAPAHPDRTEATVYWRACLHALLDEPDLAIATLKDGIAQGLWWGPDLLTRDPDLTSLRMSPELADVVRICEARLAVARSSATPGLEVAGPDDAATPSPLLMALHGRGQRPADINARWRPATTRGITVAFPRSSQPTGMNTYGWDDRERAIREVAGAYRQLARSESIDPARVITGGVSQGAAVALRLALTGDSVPALGFIAVVPAIRNAAFDEAISAAARRGVRGWLITGERDYGRSDAEALRARLIEAGVPCALDVVPGLGHDMPEDFEDRLPSALDFVLDQRA